MKHQLFAIGALLSLTLVGHAQRKEWEDPRINQINREPM